MEAHIEGHCLRLGQVWQERTDGHEDCIGEGEQYEEDHPECQHGGQTGEGIVTLIRPPQIPPHVLTVVNPDYYTDDNTTHPYDNPRQHAVEKDVQYTRGIIEGLTTLKPKKGNQQTNHQNEDKQQPPKNPRPTCLTLDPSKDGFHHNEDPLH